MAAPEERFRARFDDVHGVVRVEWVAGSTIDLETARLVTATCQGFTPERPRVLVDTRGDFATVERPARQHLVDDLDKVAAMALLVDSALSRMVANLFIRAQRRRVPMMLFTDEGEALNWLVGQRG